MALPEEDQTGISPNHSGRNGAKIRYFALHTQEGGGTARSLAGYLQRANSGVSYHYSVDNREIIDVVDTDRYSWSVLDANRYTINLCFAGSRAAQSRDVWLNSFGNAIDEAARLFVQDAKKYGMPVDVLGRNYGIIPQRQGAIDHSGVTYGLGIGDHTDVGPNFPWDVFTDRVNAHSRGTVVIVPPVRNEINHVQSFSPWLGARLDADEQPCGADGKGRYVMFAEGWIYWSEATGAHPIPKSLFTRFAELGWEKGEIGYPLTDHAVVPGGEVQGFQNGALYRKDGLEKAVWVHGFIFDLWMKNDWERGQYGWPMSEEVAVGNIRYQDFERGRIYYVPDKVMGTLFVEGPDTPLADPLEGVSPAAVTPPAPVGWQPGELEKRATPLDGMAGGISHFAGTTDASTRGRNMGISGEPADNPKDPWYCAMRFNYCKVAVDPKNPYWVKPVPGSSDLALKSVLEGLRLKVTNPANGKAVVVRPADWGPGAWAKPNADGKPYRVIDVSAHAERMLGAATDDRVVVEWVDPQTPLGPTGSN